MAGKSSRKNSKDMQAKAKAGSGVSPSTAAAEKKLSTKKNNSAVPPSRSRQKTAKPLQETPQANEASVEESETPSTLTLADLPPKRRQSFVEKQHQRLLDLRDDILGQMQGIAQDSLRVRPEGSEASGFGMHQADAGTDAYDKDFALSLLSQEQDALYEIEEAIKRIEAGTYGICEMSGEPIPLQRLEAAPHARFTVTCQRQVELQNRFERRWESVPQFGEAAEAGEEEEEAGEEREGPGA
jgi:RNA polymerase-binding transcription factor DksA